MKTIHEILSHFENVKKSGSNQYQCKCPSHEDRSNSMGVSLSDDGQKIIMNCFAGCTLTEVMQASGLTWDDIMPNKRVDSFIMKDGEVSGMIKQRQSFNPYAALKYLANDILFVAMCAAEVNSGRKLIPEDQNKLLKSVGNTRRLYDLCK